MNYDFQRKLLTNTLATNPEFTAQFVKYASTLKQNTDNFVMLKIGNVTISDHITLEVYNQMNEGE